MTTAAPHCDPPHWHLRFHPQLDLHTANPNTVTCRCSHSRYLHCHCHPPPFLCHDPPFPEASPLLAFQSQSEVCVISLVSLERLYSDSLVGEKDGSSIQTFWFLGHDTLESEAGWVLCPEGPISSLQTQSGHQWGARSQMVSASPVVRRKPCPSLWRTSLGIKLDKTLLHPQSRAENSSTLFETVVLKGLSSLPLKAHGY